MDPSRQRSLLFCSFVFSPPLFLGDYRHMMRAAQHNAEGEKSLRLYRKSATLCATVQTIQSMRCAFTNHMRGDRWQIPSKRWWRCAFYLHRHQWRCEFAKVAKVASVDKALWYCCTDCLKDKECSDDMTSESFGFKRVVNTFVVKFPTSGLFTATTAETAV